MATEPANIRAKDILEMLSQKHTDDVFISECKTGSSWKGCLRMDSWAMKRSWANSHTYGYEIKINRQDFLNDEKWPGYLQYCSHFSFACPSGLIKASELPDKVGLYYMSETGNRLFTKRKPVLREVEISEDLWRYILKDIQKESMGKENSDVN